MSTEYAGNNSFPVTITVMTDDDPHAAASFAVSTEQLADRTAYLKARIDGGLGFEFTDAILHGATTFPDGSIAIDVTSMSVAVVNNLTVHSDGNLAFTADSFNVLSGRFTVAPGATQIGTGSDVITVTGNTLALGNTDLTGGTGCDVSLDGTCAFGANSTVNCSGITNLNGKLRISTVLDVGGAITLNGNTGYEFILIDNPAARVVTIANTGASQGQRLRLNAQKVVTGANDHEVDYGARTWFMRNAATKTVILEFVFDGTNWVVDDWAEGGNAGRNG